MKSFFAWFFAALYIGPYFYLIPRVAWDDLVLSKEIFTVLGQSSLQAFLSSAFIVMAGYFSLLGFLSIKNRKTYIGFLGILLLPNFVPSLIVIMSSILVWESLGVQLRFGMWPVICVHVAMNVGLCVLFWKSLLKNKLGGMLELARVEGLQGYSMHLLIWQLLKKEIVLMGFGFFTLCFTSFSVPLILGGNSGRTLEVYAFEVLSIHGSIGSVMAIGLLQWMFFALILLFVKYNQSSRKVGEVSLSFLAYPGMLFIPLVAFSFCCLGLFYKLHSGMFEFFSNAVLVHSLPGLIQRSLAICVAVGIFTYFLFYATVFATQKDFFNKAILSFATPSVVLYGLCIYFFPLQITTKIALGLALMFLPVLYRLLGASILQGLKSQTEVARSLGASSSLIVNAVIWPQVRPMAMMFAGIAALWASGDFAFSSVVSGEISNLALSAKSMLGSYHLELALVYVCLAFLVGFFIFTIFWGLSYVIGGKFKFENWGV